MNYEKFKLNPVDALYSQICEANPLLRPGTFTVTKVTDLGAAANPNTVATIVGDGIGTIGTKQVTFNRLNPKNTFSKYVAVIKRPTIDVFGVDAPPVGQNMTLATLANDISKVLGISLTTAGTYADADGSQTVTMPSAGSAVDSDITINKPNSLRFRPSATDKLPIRLRNAGIHWSVDAVDSDIRPRERNDIDDSDKSLVCRIPFGETLDAVFAGDYVNLPFNAAAGYGLSGAAVANSSGIALSTSELSKSDELLLMPFNQSLIDLVTGTNGSIASGTAYYDSPGMRRDIGLRSTNCSATVPNEANVRSAFTGTKQWTIEFEAIIPTVASGIYQHILTSQRSNGWSSSTIGIFVSSGGRVGLSMRTSPSVGVTINTYGWNDGKCHTFAFTRTATGLLAFVDGVLVATVPTVASVQAGTAPLRIMSFSDAAGGFFLGRLRNLRIWNFAKITEGYTPFGFYEKAKANINLVSMVGKERDSSKWTDVAIINPITTEPDGTAVKWLLSIGGKYYTYDDSYTRIEVGLADAPTMGMSTSFLKSLSLHLSGNFVSSKLALVAALITTDGKASPSVLSVDVSGRIPFSAYAFSVVSYPTPAQTVGGLRDGIGTLFYGNGINLGTHGNTASSLLLGEVFGGQNDWTIEFDIVRKLFGTAQCILWQRASTASTVMSVYVGFNADNTLYYGYYPLPGTSFAGRSSVAAITDGLKHHIEVNRSGGLLRLFIDGVLDSTMAATADNASVPTSPFYLGRQPTTEPEFQRPPYCWLRDFCIYSYARHTSNYEVEPYVNMSDDISLNNDEVHPLHGALSASALLYGVDFRPAIDGVGLDTIIAQSTATVLGGDVVTALNQTLQNHGIPIQLPPTLTLVGMTVPDIYNIAPDASAGQNPKMGSVIMISSENITRTDKVSVGGIITLHLK